MSTTAATWQPTEGLQKFRVMRSTTIKGRAACEQAVSRPHVWASDIQAAQKEARRVMGESYFVTTP